MIRKFRIFSKIFVNNIDISRKILILKNYTTEGLKVTNLKVYHKPKIVFKQSLGFKFEC